MKKSASSSAPGKIHLIGEHSSVFGKPALLVAINKRLKVTINISDRDVLFTGDSITLNAISAIKEFIVKKYDVPICQTAIQVRSDIPIGSGMGSSAALSAAVAGAFYGLYDLPWNLDEIYKAAYEGERVFHGNPSGGDLAASIWGGVVWFRKETEDIKFYKKISVSKYPVFFSIPTGKPLESTKEMVLKVGMNYKKYPKQFHTIMDHQEELTKKMSELFLSANFSQIDELLHKAEINLEKMGVVGKRAQSILMTLHKNGYEGKISGGGGLQEGSGMIIIKVDDSKLFRELCNENSWEYEQVVIVNEGLRRE